MAGDGAGLAGGRSGGCCAPVSELTSCRGARLTSGTAMRSSIVPSTATGPEVGMILLLPFAHSPPARQFDAEAHDLREPSLTPGLCARRDTPAKTHALCS